MTSPNFRLSLGCLSLLVFTAFMITSCELGQTVMVSKGEAGGFSEAFGGNSQYCKMTMTPGVTISEAAQEAFVKYCADVE
jgi:preprotein translocase subunit SecG